MIIFMNYEASKDSQNTNIKK